MSLTVQLQPLLAHFQQAPREFNCFLVGGVIRDQLLNQWDPAISVREVDWVVVGSQPEALLKRGFKQVGKDFPVFLHNHTGEEYALARKEKKQAPGHRGFGFDFSADISLEQDLVRRDLTINALAMDRAGQLHDPYQGLLDLENRWLRHISPAFIEDPLRVFRVARFYARFAHLGFRIAPETLELMQALVDSGELAHLKAERVWQETHKALNSHSPQLYFQCLHQVGALKEWFSELEALFGIPQTARWHPEIDSGLHTLMVIEQANRLRDLCSQPTSVLWAALTHDLGKALTPVDRLPSHPGHEQRGIALTKHLNQRLKVPKAIAQTALLGTTWHTHFHAYYQLKPATYLKVLERTDAWRKPCRFKDLLLVSEADSRGRLGFEYHSYPSRQLWLRLLENTSTIKPRTFVDAKQIQQDLQHQRLVAIERIVAQQGLQQNL